MEDVASGRDKDAQLFKVLVIGDYAVGPWPSRQGRETPAPASCTDADGRSQEK
jgi:hypothetical protein